MSHNIEDINRFIIEELNSQGHPGALSVLKQLRDDFGPIPLVALRNAGITGMEVWILYSDVCDKDIQALVDMLEDGSAMAKLKTIPDSGFYEER